MPCEFFCEVCEKKVLPGKYIVMSAYVSSVDNYASNFNAASQAMFHSECFREVSGDYWYNRFFLNVVYKEPKVEPWRKRATVFSTIVEFFNPNRNIDTFDIMIAATIVAAWCMWAWAMFAS